MIRTAFSYITLICATCSPFPRDLLGWCRLRRPKLVGQTLLPNAPMLFRYLFWSWKVYCWWVLFSPGLFPCPKRRTEPDREPGCLQVRLPLWAERNEWARGLRVACRHFRNLHYHGGISIWEDGYFCLWVADHTWIGLSMLGRLSSILIYTLLISSLLLWESLYKDDK